MVDLCLGALIVALLAASEALGGGKARLCVVGRVDGSGSSVKYCPLINVPESPAVCVIAFDRLECLRRLKEGKADFAVLEAENLIVASKSSGPQILITNELRIWRKRSYENQMLVIVRNTLNITGVADLRGRRLCHPGHDLSIHWTDATSKYFESQVAPQGCEPNLTVLENFIKSSSEFFGAACKPGPWVDDEDLDFKLKSKYSNLCQLCDLPKQCGVLDKYWGPDGSLICLSDEAGDVAWARLADVLFHFGIDPDVPALAVPAEFSALCPDGTLQPLAPLTTNSPPPCSWMSRPWPVVAARQDMAEDIKKLVMSINRTSTVNWQWALHFLLATNGHEVIPVDITTPEDYLAKAKGFAAGDSCGAQRAVRWCVESEQEAAKCWWWREAALAHGVQPPLECVRPRTRDRGCAGALADGAAEVGVVHAGSEAVARRLGLKPLVYEYSSKFSDYFVASVIVKTDSTIEKLSDLRGKKACFMNHMGIGWNSLVSALKERGLLPHGCPYEKAISSYFSEACVPGLNATSQEGWDAPNLHSLCRQINQLKGRPRKHAGGERCCEEAAGGGGGLADAFHCLASGHGDVAVVDMGPWARKQDAGQDKEPWTKYIPSNSYRILCTGLDGRKACHIGWSPKGLVMSNADATPSRMEEVYVLLLQMDSVFGKRRKTSTGHAPIPNFILYGPYDGTANVIFQDSTHYMVKIDTLKKESPLMHNYEDILNNVLECSSAIFSAATMGILIICSLLLFSM